MRRDGALWHCDSFSRAPNDLTPPFREPSRRPCPATRTRDRQDNSRQRTRLTRHRGRVHHPSIRTGRLLRHRETRLRPHPDPPQDRGRGREQQAPRTRCRGHVHHLPSAHAPLSASPSLARAPAPMSWSAHPHRTSSLLQLARHPEARHAPHSDSAPHTPESSTGSASASTSASYTGARRTVLGPWRAPASDTPSLFFPPLHILPCAEQAESGKRIPRASPLLSFRRWPRDKHNA
ncbi:hypothetical protein B0H14DRAFT_3901836 [Mycena olivaceomarginata]|nr:hypothetical protein B0H14DRAFT_3901836 [Mycena olivaceomarginata]